MQEEQHRSGPAPRFGGGPVVKAAAYFALFVLGAVEALVGTFQYGRGPGSLVAICFAVGILVTGVLGGWGMTSGAGGVLPAGGWFLVSVLLGTSTRGGTVFVVNDTQGKWFLYGGAVCAAGGAILAFARWSRTGPRRRS
jgi:hypothetical protein